MLSSTEKDDKQLSLKDIFALELENLLIWTLDDKDLQELAQRLTNKTKEWLEQKQEKQTLLVERLEKSSNSYDTFQRGKLNQLNELVGEVTV